MDAEKICEANQNLPQSSIAIRLNLHGGDIELWCDNADGKLIRWSSDHGINLLLDANNLRIVGLEMVDGRGWAIRAIPALGQIWKQLQSAFSERDKADASVRLFHAALCVALPEMADAITELYPEE